MAKLTIDFLITIVALAKSSRAFHLPSKSIYRSLQQNIPMLSDAKNMETETLSPTTGELSKRATQYHRWGIDNDHPNEYWYDSRIHTLGNHGFLGAVHAALAPLSTKMIDRVAYNGVDIRRAVAEKLSSKYRKQRAKVLDMCCGVGFSTRALVDAFPDAEKIVGVDTSNEMLAMARFISAHVQHLGKLWDTSALIASTWRNSYKSAANRDEQIRLEANGLASTSFRKLNAECTSFQDGSFDVVTIMYAFHEAPMKGRARILKEVRRLLNPGGILAVIDIATDYSPSASMLAGEPYVLEYQKNIDRQLGHQKGFTLASYEALVPGHVGMWTLKRTSF